MANDAPNQVEQLLQRYAQRRREQAGAPFELHPADRRQLLEEAARLYGQGQAAKGRRTGFGAWMAFLPRFGLALGLFAVLGLVVWALWLNNQPPGFSPTFAKNNTPSAKKPLPAGSKIAEPSKPSEQDLKLGMAKAAIAVNRAEPASAKAADKEAPTAMELAPTSRANDGIAQAVVPPSPPPAPAPAPEVMMARGLPKDEAKKKEQAMIEAERLAEQQRAAMSLAQDETRRRDAETAEKARAESLRRNAEAAAARATEEKAVAMRQEKSAVLPPAAIALPVPAPSQAVERKLAFADKQASDRGISEYYFAYAKDAASDQPTVRAVPGAAGGSLGVGMTTGRARLTTEPEMAKATADQAPKKVAATAEDSARRRFAILAETAADAKLPEGAAAQVLLAAFEVEIVGDRIRIIDTDGSVYEGALESRPVVAAAKPAANGPRTYGQPGMARSIGGGGQSPRPPSAPNPTVSEARDRDAQAASGSLTFQATGTSRRLGQPVTINGAWFGATNRILAERQNETVARRETVAGKEAAAPPTATPGGGKISGFLRVGAGPERPLNAVQVE